MAPIFPLWTRRLAVPALVSIGTACSINFPCPEGQKLNGDTNSDQPACESGTTGTTVLATATATATTTTTTQASSGSTATSSSSESSSATPTTTADPTSSGTTSAADPECGNGRKEGEEECDDGNLDDADDCTAECKKATCGDAHWNKNGAAAEPCEWSMKDAIAPCIACSAACKCVKAVDIAAGDNHTCALLADNDGNNRSIRCWGMSDKFQTGYSAFSLDGENPTPRDYYRQKLHGTGDIMLPESPIGLFAGADTTCVTTAEGIHCFGSRPCLKSEMTCPGPRAPHPCDWTESSATKVTEITDLPLKPSLISIGRDILCTTASNSDGVTSEELRCTLMGKLPDSSTFFMDLCTAKEILQCPTSVDYPCIFTHAAGPDFLIELRSTADTNYFGVRGWGASDKLQTAQKDLQPWYDPPLASTVILQSFTPTIVDAGDSHACAASPVDKMVWCWGRNDEGQVTKTPEPNTSRAFKNELAVSTSVERMTTGADFTCVSSNNMISCWGDAPLLNKGYEHSSKIMAIVSGAKHICALDDNGYVLCAGPKSLNGTDSDSPSDKLVSISI